MKDGIERRALLLHLGEVMETVACLLKREAGQRSVRRLAETDTSLASLPLLEHVSPRMTPVEFAQRASAAFCTWPSELLEAELNREELASTVQQHLFAGNPDGWRAYVAELRVEVPWFGEGVAVLEAVAEPVWEAVEDAPEADAPESSDIERASDSETTPRESVETSERIYPSWPWKPGT
ncbi:hypothetical protein FAZ95_37865 [Trinickia violacea]|uniref:Uncharacterized protein n=1 Tax=Trinickia violacea TaxID=2571746 RepID=A0A4P8J1D0_9BURK|nr:hypothetical protein [Trinickia violacea]QCP54637.1 hypothetical protein FAZ95_37865 [Trinickia violacea]